MAEYDSSDDAPQHDHAHLARLDLERAAGALTSAYAVFLGVMRDSLADEHWAVPGIRSPEHWLTCFAGVSRAAATDLVRIASRADELPHAIAAFESTQITFHQLAVIARHVPAGYDADVTALAAHCDVGQLRRVVAKYPFPTEEDGSEEPGASEGSLPDPDAATEPARLRSWFDEGRYHLEFDGPIDQGEMIEQALNEAKNHLFQATRSTDENTADAEPWDAATNQPSIPPAFGGLNRPRFGDGLDASGKPRITLAAALVEAMTRSLHAGTTGVAGRADAYRVLFHYDTDGHAWTSVAGALPPALRDKLSCDGLAVPVREEGGVPVDVGRTLRIVPRRTRRLVEDRDQGCRFPGCGARRYVEVHHVIHWQRGGPTDLANLISLCPFHHDRLHACDFTISADEGGRFVFRDQFGERYGYRPQPPESTSTSPPAPSTPYERQSWEPLHLEWIEFQHTG